MKRARGKEGEEIRATVTGEGFTGDGICYQFGACDLALTPNLLYELNSPYVTKSSILAYMSNNKDPFQMENNLTVTLLW